MPRGHNNGWSIRGQTPNAAQQQSDTFQTPTYNGRGEIPTWPPSHGGMARCHDVPGEVRCIPTSFWDSCQRGVFRDMEYNMLGIHSLSMEEAADTTMHPATNRSRPMATATSPDGLEGGYEDDSLYQTYKDQHATGAVDQDFRRGYPEPGEYPEGNFGQAAMYSEDQTLAGVASSSYPGSSSYNMPMSDISREFVLDPVCSTENSYSPTRQFQEMELNEHPVQAQNDAPWSTVNPRDGQNVYGDGALPYESLQPLQGYQPLLPNEQRRDFTTGRHAYRPDMSNGPGVFPGAERPDEPSTLLPPGIIDSVGPFQFNLRAGTPGHDGSKPDIENVGNSQVPGCNTAFLSAPYPQGPASDASSPPCSVTSHSQATTLQCDECDAEFTGEYRLGNLQRHRRLKHKERVQVFQCSVERCARIFRRQDARLNHYRRHHPELAPYQPVRRGPQRRGSS